MKLFEIFDKPVKWKIVTKSNNEFMAKFFINKKEYHFDASYGGIQDDAWEVFFELIDEEGYGSMDVTNSGDEYAVFATVIEIMKEFVKLYDPDKITFSAQEENRRGLYIRMFRKYASQYKLQQTSPGEFIATKK